MTTCEHLGKLRQTLVETPPERQWKEIVKSVLEIVKDRDIEWWRELALVDSVAPNPQAVKRWILAEMAYKPDNTRSHDEDLYG